MDLTQPGIIQFGQRDKIELYLRPGDSLWIEMINARNISFGGSAARENTLLAQLEKRPFILHEILESPSDFSQLVDKLYNEQMQRLALYEVDHPDPGFVSLYLAKVYRDSLRFIWVQLGGPMEVWQRTIAEVSNTYAVQHCYLNDPAAIAALKPYFFQAELPMAFKLDGDLKITGMSKHPNPTMDWLFERMVVGGRVIWRGRE